MGQSIINKRKLLEKEWVEAKKVKDEIKSRKYFMKHFWDRLMSLEGEIEEIIINEFMQKLNNQNVSLVKIEEYEDEDDTVHCFYIKKSGDNKIYRLEYNIEEDWHIGLYYDAGYEKEFWCGCGEVQDLYYELRDANIL